VKDTCGSATAATAWAARHPRHREREVIEMTQIKLLVIMPVPGDQQAAADADDDAARDATFTDQVNAILRFDGGWRLAMNRAEFPGATSEDTEMAGAADEPPVKEAIAALARAAAAKPDSEEGASDDSDAEEIKAHTQTEVLQFAVPEGSSTVQVRVEPEVFVENGEPHIRVKVNDPAWVKDTGSKDTSSKNTGSKDTSSKDTSSPE
jgi:hypothetical protein